MQLPKTLNTKAHKFSQPHHFLIKWKGRRHIQQEMSLFLAVYLYNSIKYLKHNEKIDTCKREFSIQKGKDKNAGDLPQPSQGWCNATPSN